MPSLLIVDDDRSITRIFQRCFEHTDITVVSAASGAEAVKATAELKPDVVVLDIFLPDQSGLSAYEEIRRLNPMIPIVFITASGTSDTAIESMRLGAMDYLSKPLDMAKIRDVVSQALAISKLMRVTVAKDELADSDATSPAGTTSSDALIGHCPAMQEVYKAIGRVSGQNINVLIRGESGTGKELVARAIHQHSTRVGKKFLAVNCAAIPESLLESELFGHEKGSFTGAVSQRIGKFEECDGGTLFLDEVGDMPILMQSKVLRAIQEKEFQRVGGNYTIKSDTRIIAATNRDLDAMVSSGEFRADLCYRLNGYTILLPLLRDRCDDIPLLVEYYLHRFNYEIGKAIAGVAPETMERLKRYSWPGNIRELQTVLRHAMLHAIGPILLPEFLPAEMRDEVGPSPPPRPLALQANAIPAAGETFSDPLRERGEVAFHEFIENQLREGTDSLYADSVKYMECILLTDVLSHTNGNQSQAALLLGITRGCLRSKLRMHGIMISSSVAVQEPVAGA
ncbi:MAG: sigma-54 dependent transcriptional regulator [Thermoguttaceae bacterium]